MRKQMKSPVVPAGLVPAVTNTQDFILRYLQPSLRDWFREKMGRRPG